MTRKLAWIFTLMIGVTVPAAVATLAHEGATGVVETRMDTMKSFASQLKALSSMIRGKSEFDSASATAAAQSISDYADKLPGYFPNGSNEDPSRAAAAIWTDWDAFLVKIDQMKAQADDLRETAANASQASDISDGFQELGESCKSCHTQFRSPK